MLREVFLGVNYTGQCRDATCGVRDTALIARRFLSPVGAMEFRQGCSEAQPNGTPVTIATANRQAPIGAAENTSAAPTGANHLFITS